MSMGHVSRKNLCERIMFHEFVAQISSLFFACLSTVNHIAEYV